MVVHRTTLPAVIDAGETTSNAVDLVGYDLVGLVIPSTFDGTSVNLETSNDAETWYSLNDGTGAAEDFSVATDEWTVISEAFGRSTGRYIRVVAATQTAGATVLLAGRAD